MNKSIINDFRDCFTMYRELGVKCFDQLTEQELNYSHGIDSNSIATIVKHMHGNMLSRWTNFLSEDGEKSWRNRDAEFMGAHLSKTDILFLWNEGWTCVTEAMKTLNEDNLNQIVFIRSEPHSVHKAVMRQIAHYAYHTGQIVLIAKLIRGNNWQSLSIPKGSSEQFNKALKTKFGDSSESLLPEA